MEKKYVIEIEKSKLDIVYDILIKHDEYRAVAILSCNVTKTIDN